MSLSCVTVSIGYADFLPITIKNNLKYVDDLIVVTSEDDIKTIEYCEMNSIKFTKTNQINLSDSVPFKKFHALNLGIRTINPTDWILCLDSDVLVLNTLDLESFSKKCLYYARRKNCFSVEDFNRYGTDLRCYSYDLNEAKAPYGFFHLFNVNNSSINKSLQIGSPVYPEIELVESDLLFVERWNKWNIRSIDNDVLHLGKPKENWNKFNSSFFKEKEIHYEVI